MSLVTTRKVGTVLVAVADNPPVNALSRAVRAGLCEALAEAEKDHGVEAVVIRCAGRTFFAGCDIGEMGKPSRAPSFPGLIDDIEESGKPVVAAIHGTAMGGGLEVALGCHYRIAASLVRLGLPEVKLGLLPGAGGTQRLPRVVGVEEALRMIVTGDPVSAEEALAIGLVDRIALEEDLESAAVAFAREVAGRERHPMASHRADKLEEAAGDPELFERFRRENARLFRGFEAPHACVEAVKAAVELPFGEGVATEHALYAKLMASDQAKALRHVFIAEHNAAGIDDVPAGTPLVPVGKVGVVGAGTMGAGIAMNFLSAGLPVVMVERDRAALDRGVSAMRRSYESAAERGRLSGTRTEEALGRLTATLDDRRLADCDLVIEAVFEDMALKKEVFRRLDGIVKAGAILASNTSYLDIDEMAAGTRRPEAVLGLHFFAPANIMRLLEVVRAARTSDSVLATGMDLGRRIGKVAVMARMCPGFIGNRMLAVRQREAQKLILEGAKPWDVDRVLIDFGFPMGPFQMSDLAGLDIGWDPETSRGETIRDVLCERDRRGQKTDRGYYDYTEGREPRPSPEVEEIIAEFMLESQSRLRWIGDQEILERLLYPLVNEGAGILEEGIAQRASDIDVVWLNGYGWPAWTGGPMFWADTVGLDKIVDRLRAQADRLGTDFNLSRLLADKAAAGGQFNE